MFVKRVFSGIQATGIPHIGNYLGAIKNWVQLQTHSKEYGDVLFSVVDLHAFTCPQDPTALRANIFDMVASLLACGIDPNKSILFQQSQVPYHCELAWYLSCLAPTGQLNRMHQWKVKGSKSKGHANLGLYSYPVLMAADVLLYRATHVPVGEDQVQHLELTRDLSDSFNKRYSKTFPLPDIVLTKSQRIMNLRDPTKKMSKSEANSNTRVDITDTPDVIESKIKKAVTDSTAYLTDNLSRREGVQNLIDIYSAFADCDKTEIIHKYRDVQYFTKSLKEDLTEIIVAELNPLRKEFERIRKDEDYLAEILRGGSEQACAIAELVMKDVRSRLGVR